MIKPKVLRPGATLGLIAPAGSLKDPGHVDVAAAMLGRLGFKAKVGESCRLVHGYLAGTDSIRAADVHRCFADPNVDGIVCLKGGYGSPRILEELDYGLIARNPKIFVGFSDITAMHIALHNRCGLVTLHGPMGTSDALVRDDAFTTRHWLRALTSPEPLGRLANPPSAPRKTLVGGKAHGQLIGGNLCLISAMMGTPFEIDVRGKLLFLEDVAEEPYRIDRMLNQLRLAGKFDECAGIVLGSWTGCVAEETHRTLSLDQIFEDHLMAAGKPVLAGVQAGHGWPSLSLPFGVEALLDADAMTLDIHESMFISD